MKLLDLLVQLNPSIQQLRDSEQFQLSKQIIKKRISLELNQKEFSKMLAFPFDRLVQLEACDLNVSVDEYKEVLKFIESRVADFKLGFDIPLKDFVLKIDANTPELMTIVKFNGSSEKVLKEVNYINSLEGKSGLTRGIYASSYESINTSPNEFSMHVFESSFEASNTVNELLNNSQNLKTSRASLISNRTNYHDFRHIPVA
jgi:hypothetical protein